MSKNRYIKKYHYKKSNLYRKSSKIDISVLDQQFIAKQVNCKTVPHSTQIRCSPTPPGLRPPRVLTIRPARAYNLAAGMFSFGARPPFYFPCMYHRNAFGRPAPPTPAVSPTSPAPAYNNWSSSAHTGMVIFIGRLRPYLLEDYSFHIYWQCGI